MYSMVLMAALTTTSGTPDWLFHHACHGCCSGWGGGVYSGGYSGCSGCCGGWGAYWGGGWGGGYGYWGSVPPGPGAWGGAPGAACASGVGCYPCAGFGHGMGSFYPSMTGSAITWCYGGCWGDAFGCHGCYGCYGCVGCTGMQGPGTGCVGPVIGGPAAPVTNPPADLAPPPSKTGSQTNNLAPNRARLVVEVPEDARLYIDDHLMKSTSTRRVYTTPALQKGETYYYDVRVEVTRDGKTYTDRKQVIIKPGQDYQESFADLGRRRDDSAIVDARRGK